MEGAQYNVHAAAQLTHIHRAANEALAEMTLQIGGVALRLRGERDALWEAAHERYVEFRASSEAAFPIEMRASGEPASAAAFQYVLNQCHMILSPLGAHFSNLETVYELDSLLRILLSQRLVKEHGLLLHAATIERDGVAYVFMGRSGAGKSTVASLSPEGSVFTDEISLLRCTAGEWRAFGTPFWGEFRAGNQNRSAPVARIFMLVQARENRCTAIPRRRALAELLSNTLFFSNARADREALLNVAERLVNRVPVAGLEFRRDSSFWETIAP